MDARESKCAGTDGQLAVHLSAEGDANLADWAPMAEALGDLLTIRARQTPDRIGYTFLNYSGAEKPTAQDLTYNELLTRAQSIAARIQDTCSSGDRVLVLCPPGLDYIAAFFACQLADVVAVPADLPANVATRTKAARILAGSNPQMVLTTADARESLVDFETSSGALPPRLIVDAPAAFQSDTSRLAGHGARETAWLQYNCEATGFGKGVLTPPAAAVAQCRAVAARVGLEAGMQTVSCLPLTHNMGMIAGVLMPVVIGSRCTILAMHDFIARPNRFLQAIGDERATHVTAPPLVYRHAARRISDQALDTIDLSPLRVAVCGGEVIQPADVDAFERRFAPCGLRPGVVSPAFGVREAVSMITGTAPDAPTSGIALTPSAAKAHRLQAAERIEGNALSTAVAAGRPVALAAGRVLDGHTLAIVDPQTATALPEGAVGEIWVSGPTVATGYYDDAEASTDRFRARLAGQPSGRIYLRTSYLGALIAGELFPLMSLDGSIMIRGARHAAAAVEAELERAVPGLGQGRTVAFRIAAEDREGVILVHELRADVALDRQDLVARMRQAVAQSFKITAEDIVLVVEGQLPRDSSGAPDRARIRHLYLAGCLRETAHHPQ